MQLYLIYKITNLINGKIYIGQTGVDRLAERIYEHQFETIHSETNVAFHNAITKYGFNNFSVEVVETNISEELIDERERYYISFYNSYIHAENSNGYNETLGGQGTHGYIFTETDRLKMSMKQKAYWKNLKETNIEEYNRLCEIRRQNKLKYVWTEESRAKLSNSCKGRTPWNKGKKGLQEGWNKGSSVLPKINMIDTKTNAVLRTFNNCYEAAREVFPEKLEKTCASRIYSVCKKNKGQAYGYYWRFEIV